MNTLQKTMAINATITFISGILILLLQYQLMDIFETDSNTPFWVVGAVITVFSLTMFIEIKKQRAMAILWIIVQDAAWVIASALVLINRPFDISDTGYLLMELYALPVLIFIFYQSKGLAKIDQMSGSNKKRMTYERIVHSDKKSAWKVISDVANYHLVASNIDSVKIVSGNGEGMIRKCAHKNESWSETCTLWDNEKEYAFLVDTSAADYPYPFSYLRGNWKLDELGNNRTKITMVFEFEYQKYIQHLLIHPFLKHKFNQVCKDLLSNWQRMIEK